MYNKAERIGKMRHRIRFMKPLTGRGDYGQETKTWITSTYIFAAIEYTPAGSDESDVATRKQAFTQARIMTRYRETVYPKMRIKADSQEFEILSVLPDGKREYMEIEAVVDGPREIYYVDPNGQEWTDGSGNKWVFSNPGDIRTAGSGLDEWTDSAGIIWNPA